MTRAVVALALWSHTMPSAWEHEDPRVLETALEMMADAMEAQDGAQEG